MKKLYKILVCFLAVSMLNACEDDKFLEEHPKTTYTTDNFFTTSSQVDLAVISCYSYVRSIFNMCKQNNFACEVLRGNNGSDMFTASFANNGQIFTDYSLISADHEVFKNIYAWWYELISKANLVVYAANLDNIQWSSSEDKAYALAQARFFRAWAYKNLGEEFGGVPIVDKFVDEAHYDYKRSTRIETYQFAIDEMEAILNDLPETTPVHGRLVKAAALHNLSELYLAKGIVLEQDGNSGDAKTCYSTSIKYADKVINGGTYSLMTSRFGSRKDDDPVFYFAEKANLQTPDHLYTAVGVNIKGNCYWDLFQQDNQDYQDGNRESIWTIQCDVEAAYGGDNQARLCYSRMFSPWFRKVNENFAGTMEDVGGSAVAYIVPTYYTRDIIYEGKWADDMRNSDAVYRRTFVGNVIGAPLYGKVVPWDQLYQSWRPVDDETDLIRTRMFPASCKTYMDIYPDASRGGNKQHIFRDDYMIRLPETILLRAEAKMRNGDNAGAAEDINMLRDRSQCEYKVTSSDVCIDLILDERARELVYEEMRWNTLLRMGGSVAVDRIKKYGKCFGYTSVGSVKDFNLWPIPQSVIDTNKDIPMEQNPGWN